MGSGLVYGERFPECCSENPRKEEYKEEVGFDREGELWAEAWFRVERMVCVRQCDRKGAEAGGEARVTGAC